MNTTIHADRKRTAVVPTNEGRILNVIGNRVTVKLGREETAGACYVFEVDTLPGGGVPPHVHQHEDEVIHVLEGQLEVELGGHHYQVGAGATIHFPRFKPHAFRNSGRGSTRTLWTVLPGIRFEQFFEELAALPAGPPDLEKVGAIFHKIRNRDSIPMKPLTQRLKQAIACFNAGDFDGYFAIYAPHAPVSGMPPGFQPTVEGLRQYYTLFRQAFPDLHVTFDDTVEEDNRIAVRATWRGTHRGEFMGAAPTGKACSGSGLTILHFTNGLCTKRWFINDEVGLLHQLGLMPDLQGVQEAVAGS